MNNLTDQINIEEAQCRELDVLGLVQLLKNDINVYWSWGTHALRNINNKGLRFKVNGHHHKGHVYIFLNGLDLFDVYLTTTRGKILHIMTDIYFDDLVNRIDNRIERIEEYN